MEEKIPLNIIGSDEKIWLTPEQYVHYLKMILEQEKEKENYEECEEITELIKKYE